MAEETRQLAGEITVDSCLVFWGKGEQRGKHDRWPRFKKTNTAICARLIPSYYVNPSLFHQNHSWDHDRHDHDRTPTCIRVL